MKILKVSSAFFVLLTGAVYASPPTTLPDEVKDLIVRDFIDPDSAKFRDIRIGIGANAEEGGFQVICGEVNSKNSFGGYVGFRGFSIERENGVYKNIDILPPYSADDVLVDFEYNMYKVLCPQ